MRRDCASRSQRCYGDLTVKRNRGNDALQSLRQYMELNSYHIYFLLFFLYKDIENVDLM